MPLTSRSVEAEAGLLPPVLPALLFSAARHRGPITVQPRAALGDYSVPPSRDASGLGASSSDVGSNSLSSSNTTTSTKAVNFGLPKPVVLGLGGGAAWLAMAKFTKRWPFGSRPCHGSAAAPNKQKRILIMMSLTGGGHKASADAIKAAFQELYGPAYEVLVVDFWSQHTPYPFNRVPESYSFLVNNSLLWRMSYEVTQPRAFHIPYFATIGMFIGQALSEGLDKYNPDLVVSVHPLMQHVTIDVLKNRIRTGQQRPINFATVVTDFTTCHNSWFHTDATRCFVPTEFCANLGRRMGLKERQLVQHGLPIRPVFSKRLPTKKVLRKKLGLVRDAPAVLLIGGGEGMGKLEIQVAQLAAQVGDTCQVAVICGRNLKLLNRLKTTAYLSPAGTPMKVVAVGFVDNIHEWMAACDLVITKAGPGTIAEALISGLPILLNGNVPCQEEGNIPYVVDNKVGTFETRPEQIALIVKQWLDPANAVEFAAMGRRAKALGRPEAVYQIAQDLASLADEVDFEFGPAKYAPKVRATGAVLA